MTKRGRGLDETGLKALFQKEGAPLTIQRRAVYEALRGRTDHPTADRVYAAVKARVPGMSRATAYRVLDALVRLGAARKTGHFGSAVRYDPETRPHHHLVCAVCDSVTDVAGDAVPALPRPDVRGTGFRVEDYSVHFSGVCRKCR